MRRAGAILVVCGASFLVAGCGSTAATGEAVQVFPADREPPAETAGPEAGDWDELTATELRLLLQDLLTENAMLSVATIRGSVDGEHDAETRAALRANTDRLTRSFAHFSGREAAQDFDRLWTRQIETLNALAAARTTPATDPARELAARLSRADADLAELIGRATGGETPTRVSLGLLRAHSERMRAQADAWAAGDYEAAFWAALEAHRAADVMAESLAVGLVAHRPDQFPAGPAEPDPMHCTAARLATAHAVVAQADVQIARISGRPAQIAAARQMRAMSQAHLSSRPLSPAERSRVDGIVAAIDGTAAPAAARGAAIRRTRSALSASCGI